MPYAKARTAKSANKLIVVVSVAIVLVMSLSIAPFVAWILLMALTILMLGLIGVAISGRMGGCLIDDRNRVSLSRFQIAVWTCIVLPGILAAIRANLHGLGAGTHPEDIMKLNIPREVWAVLGISVTTLSFTPLILSTKTDKESNQAQLDVTQTLLGDSDNPAAVGQVLMNSAPSDAKISDIFRGDEVGNGASIDLSKVQMFYFTIVLGIGYVFTLGRFFHPYSYGDPVQFPGFSQSEIALLGISHAGYLTYKAAPHSADANTTTIPGPTPPSPDVPPIPTRDSGSADPSLIHEPPFES